jgi:hypothetical protein
MDGNQFDRDTVQALRDTVESLASVVGRLERAIAGAPEEGNHGIIPRLITLEKRVERLWWMFPFLITGGTALGQVVARWLNL